MLPNQEQGNICLYFIFYYMQCLCHLEFYTSKNTMDNFFRNGAFVTKMPSSIELLTLQPVFLLRNAFDCVGYLSASIPDVLDPHVSTEERYYPYPA